MLSKASRRTLIQFRRHKPNYIFPDDLQGELPRIDIRSQIDYLCPDYLERTLQYNERKGEVTGAYRISLRGEAALEAYCIEEIKYNITTGIALVALIRSFLPELSAVAAWLLKQLVQ
ncbi:MAG: hypothetical protein MR935_06895 [Agathobaculum sp.]|uniref:hypothetical protein n=1 Tax=Agathobaculum sp. TaxID=2048138 RepID=UPI0025C2247F|nr:hypothetical protein [Agathobaculum sp.]MCI7125904.1 hypothetical protein [Agathobaculum sp.]MDY3710911.1 hypothetical protein [Agathobaculum sp.]